MTQPSPAYGYPQQLPPHPYPPTPVRRWWQHPALVITTLVVFPPGGIALAWLSHWSRTKKIIATVLAGLWFITPFLGDPPKNPQGDAKPQTVATAAATTAPPTSPPPAEPLSFVGQNLKTAKAAAYDAGYNALSHDASDNDSGQWDDDNWKVCFQTAAVKRVGTMPTLDFGVVRNEAPCPAKDGEPIPYPKMPKVVGQSFAKASATLNPLAFQAIEADSTYTDVTLPAAGDWTVCFQEPTAGEEVQYPKTTTAYLKVTAPGTACPKTEFTELHPAPTAPSTSNDDSDDASSSSSGGSSSSGTGSVGTITPGAYCSSPGSTGVSKTGAFYTCKGPDQERWRP
ncbi:PASTA domain-containing protein [Streptomyces sp. ScaeMP-e48]|uniref:PASTA domain-containing protein n=1 Tax=Streptomyces sp. ScaeMP-e48 TaxID=1100823 RepID=UPI00082382F9|nr:PASTA domain-containing protein [Streptomyces sp. ScaeMP-e48]SCK55671.1 PASTA domain-containing protein [Streptomyces sp. ScaeMP-e48]